MKSPAKVIKQLYIKFKLLKLRAKCSKCSSTVQMFCKNSPRFCNGPHVWQACMEKLILKRLYCYNCNKWVKAQHKELKSIEDKVFCPVCNSDNVSKRGEWVPTQEEK